MSTENRDIQKKIRAFKKKYFLNLLFKGALISLGLIISVYIIINVLEYSFRFGSLLRASLLIIFIGTASYALFKFVFRPFYYLLSEKMQDEEAAKKIGGFFPEIGDRLLNTIQLQNSKHSASDLIRAGILQKSRTIGQVDFSKAVQFSDNKRFLKYLFIPLLFIAAAISISPTLFTDSTERIVRFNKEFVPSAPFEFNIANDKLIAFKNEDFNLEISLTGQAIPENAYINDGGRKIKMQKKGSGDFSFTFKKIQSDKSITLEAAGFTSRNYKIQVVNRPDLRNFNVYLDFPNYLGKPTETLNNVGNLQIPEGTSVKWQLKTLDADQAMIKFARSEEPNKLQVSDNQIFEYSKDFFSSDSYTILLNNEYSNNKDNIQYEVDVIKDDHPKINVNVYEDTTLYSFVALGGSIADDYGLRRLKLHYSVENKSNERLLSQSVEIPINKSLSSQRYYYQWMVDSLNVDEGNTISYWLEVWDNDGVNGSKSTKTGTYIFKIPTKREIAKEIDEKSERTESDIDNRIEEARELKEKIENAEKKLRGKKELNWQDQNLLKDILKKKKELNSAIEELKKQNAELNSKRERFNKQDKDIKEKVEQLQQLMDDLLDEETKKLYEELERLLQEQQDLDQIQDVLNEMNKKEENLEKELERTLELFKRMKFEQDLDKALEELKDQTQDQERLIKETDNKKGEEQENANQEAAESEKKEFNENKAESKSSEELAKEQEELKERFKEFEEDLESLKKQNQDLKNPKSLPDTQEEQEEIKQMQQESKQHLDDNRRKKARESQQKAKDKMKQMAEQLQQMQSSMQMSMMQQNLDDLRDIVHNLIKLSFDQEDLMNEFNNVNQSDPRFVELGQKQLKLKDDAKIVEDSLMSLANRVFQIASFVTREVTSMNDHMDNSVDAIRERKKPTAVAEQQFAMTSMNNLALLLDDVLQQMQQAMSDAMGMPSQGKDNKQPGLSELQQQLNQQIEQLKKSGKSGRQLSEELAKLAAQQERIRKAFEKMQEQLEGNESGMQPGEGIPEKMEETETDLVNKQLTDETIKRQKEILTRLLQAEDAMRERELDNERKGETAKDSYDKALPKAFEEYLKLKEKEIELLKTIPPKLYPYYKKEVNDYFNRLENSQNK